MGGGKVAAVVLAAGSSSRLGQPKQLAPIAGRPALAYTLDALRASDIGPIVLVLGHAADAVAAALDLADVTVVRNEEYAEGQSTSVRAGIKALREDVGAALMVVGDQPMISPVVVNAIVAVFKETGGPFVVPIYDGEWGNPVLLARATWPLLDSLKGDTGARPILRKHMDMVLEVPVEGSLLDDIDTPDDYARIRARMEGGQ
jgi:molybdenum cofactor cytidylyltransferase